MDSKFLQIHIHKKREKMEQLAGFERWQVCLRSRSTRALVLRRKGVSSKRSERRLDGCIKERLMLYEWRIGTYSPFHEVAAKGKAILRGRALYALTPTIYQLYIYVDDHVNFFLLGKSNMHIYIYGHLRQNSLLGVILWPIRRHYFVKFVVLLLRGH